jgi:putative ABC transport system substrate-binding protein
MRRRQFIAGLGSTAAWPALRPLAADAQQPRRLPTIGFLGAGTSATAGPWAAAFIQRLRELGWIEDRTIKIDLRWADGRIDRSAEIAADFVRQKVDVIVTYSNQIVEIAKQATAAIPIVFGLAADPVGTGLVRSLAQPGGNLTGLSAQNVDLAGKRFELLREVVPRLRRLAVLFNVESIKNAALELESIRNVAPPLGVDVITSEIRPAEDIAPAFAAIKAAQADALFVIADSLMLAYRTRIHTLALAARLPTIHSVREFVEAGGLMSYGPNYPNMFRGAAEYVDKILRGTKPSDLPVEQPTRYDLVINLTTAKALDLTIPESFLLRANEVIE